MFIKRKTDETDRSPSKVMKHRPVVRWPNQFPHRRRKTRSGLARKMRPFSKAGFVAGLSSSVEVDLADLIGTQIRATPRSSAIVGGQSQGPANQ